MSVLVYTETENNVLKRNAAEVASYGVALAEKLGTQCTAIAFNAENANELGAFGVTLVSNITNTPKLFDANVYANAMAAHAQSNGVTHIVLGSSADAKYLAPLLATKLSAAYAPNVIALPEQTNPPDCQTHCFYEQSICIHTISLRYQYYWRG